MGRGSNACNTVYRRRQQRCGLKCACGVICNLQWADLQMPFWSKTIIEPPLFFHGSFYSRAYFKGTLKFWDQYVRDLKISNIDNILVWKDIEVSFLTLCLVCLFFCMNFLKKFYNVTNGEAQKPNFIKCRGTHHASLNEIKFLSIRWAWYSYFTDKKCWVAIQVFKDAG